MSKIMETTERSVLGKKDEKRLKETKKMSQ